MSRELKENESQDLIIDFQKYIEKTAKKYPECCADVLMHLIKISFYRFLIAHTTDASVNSGHVYCMALRQMNESYAIYVSFLENEKEKINE